VFHALLDLPRPKYGYWPTIQLIPSKAACTKDFGSWDFDTLVSSRPTICYYQAFWNPLVAWPGGLFGKLPDLKPGQPQDSGVWLDPDAPTEPASPSESVAASVAEPEIDPNLPKDIGHVLMTFDSDGLLPRQRELLMQLAQRPVMCD
jgi:hypothetical protein